jgi:Protein of unknown function (DUF3617)
MRAILVLALIGLVLASLVRAGDAVMLRPGRYEISVRLDLPNIEGTVASWRRTLCVPAQDHAGQYGLGALSENNPFSGCPVANVRREGGTLSFEIVCPGGNAASALAKFQLTSEAFEGRISMKLGGKNMTLTETQTGRRSGECGP